MTPPRPRLVVITTGGTISSTADADGTLRPGRDGGAMLAALDPPGAGAEVDAEVADAEKFDVEVADLMALDSSALAPRHWRRIAAAVDARVIGGAEGIVVTHGTDTLEETALWLELGHRGEVPVVLTGARYGADHPRADGPANLAGALRWAADDAARGTGVTVWFDGRVLAPLGLSKDGGADVFVGAAVDRARPAAKVRPQLPGGLPVRVDIVAAYPGADGAALDAVVAAGARGVVLEAMGAGNAGTDVLAAVRRACAAGVAVVVSTRVPNGRVDTTYGPGRALADVGAVAAPRLRPPQARVLLMAALASGSDVVDVLARWG